MSARAEQGGEKERVDERAEECAHARS
jgi:hypothetical protein